MLRDERRPVRGGGAIPLPRLERVGRGEPLLLLPFAGGVSSRGGVVDEKSKDGNIVSVSFLSPFGPNLLGAPTPSRFSSPLGEPLGFGIRKVSPPLELTVAGLEGDIGYIDH